MSDTNVGLGMVPHRRNCRCLWLVTRAAELEKVIRDIPDWDDYGHGCFSDLIRDLAKMRKKHRGIIAALRGDGSRGG